MVILRVMVQIISQMGQRTTIQTQLMSHDLIASPSKIKEDTAIFTGARITTNAQFVNLPSILPTPVRLRFSNNLMVFTSHFSQSHLNGCLTHTHMDNLVNNSLAINSSIDSKPPPPPQPYQWGYQQHPFPQQPYQPAYNQFMPPFGQQPGFQFNGPRPNSSQKSQQVHANSNQTQ